MSVYDTIRKAAQAAGKSLDEPHICRVASTLAVAYDQVEAPYEAVMREVLRVHDRAKADERAAAEQQAATEQQADVIIPLEEEGAQINYQELDNAIERGMCPRCSAKLKPVKLADYTASLYCQACRIALWPKSTK
jgi:hypothetical protein